MESYRDEDEQVEALRRWWQENGTATVVAVVLALGIGFGWQGWQNYRQQQAETASDTYQAMLQILGAQRGGEAAQSADAAALAQRLREDYAGTSYARFAALHLAAMAVDSGDLAAAEAQLRWVLGQADQGSATADVAQLRLARVLAARGDSEQALRMLAQTPAEAYRAPYAIARGDVLLRAGREDEAREAYRSAETLLAPGEGGLPSLRAKLQALSAPAPSTVAANAGDGATVKSAPADRSPPGNDSGSSAAGSEGES